MEISLFGVVAALVLLLLPLAVFQSFGNALLTGKLLRAVGRCAAAVAVATALASAALLIDNMAVTLLVCVCFVLIGSVMAAARAGSVQHCFTPALVGLGGAVTSMILFLVLLVIDVENRLSPALLVSLSALLSGTCVVPLADALREMEVAKEHHRQLPTLLLGNGSTKAEALHRIAMRGLRRAALPIMKSMGGMMITTTPILLWGLVAVGIPLLTAALLQCVVLIATLTTAVVAVGLAFAFVGYAK